MIKLRAFARVLAALLIASFSAAQTHAQTTPASLCTVTPSVTFLYFNGIRTTKAGAQADLELMKMLYGTVTAAGEPINYELMYNNTNGALLDVAEVFDQRIAAHDVLVRERTELFWEALVGGGKWSDLIAQVFPSYSDTLSAAALEMRAKLVNNLQVMRSSPISFADYQDHRTRIDGLLLKGSKLLLFAHSQGNLFANAAYDYAVSKVSPNSVKLIHVAPASAQLRGPYALADLDLVINVGLRATGPVPNSNEVIPGILLRPPGLNGLKDGWGHGLVEIYLNPSFTVADHIREYVNTALSTLQAPPRPSTTGFFNVTLTWDGAGDVDLHTFEPGGAHVYYRTPQGSAGFLDVDNTVANGPEHYYASCDPTKLQTGSYSIRVNNFARAQGRMATVQVDSFIDGVLLTRSLLQGAAQGTAGDLNPPQVMTVVVSKNAAGVYSVTAQ